MGATLPFDDGRPVFHVHTNSTKKPKRLCVKNVRKAGKNIVRMVPGERSAA